MPEPDLQTESSQEGPRLRAYAARAVDSVTGKYRTIDWIISNHPQLMQEPLSQELVYGTLRRIFSLREKLDQSLKKPLRSRDSDLYCLMLVGAYQLFHTRIPAHAAVNDTVSACAALHKGWAKGLVNGVLRSLERAPEVDERSFDHPDWLVRYLGEQYPRQHADILHANNTRAPLVLRVNQLRMSVREYSRHLDTAGIAHTVIGDTGAIRLVEPQPLRTLPEWDTGAFAAQDLGAQLAAGLQIPLLQQRANSVRQPRDQPLHILDACAAPGGKLCHLLEASAANHLLADIVGLDVQPRRVEETRRLASHLGHVPNLIVGDAARRDWWDGVAFDHILLDAPCSGTGTLRRHPDIKVLLQPADIVSHATLQRDMLDNLWHTLAPGGTLLYCTCSILNNENDDVIDSFLEANAAATQDATVLTFSLTTGSATRRGWQLLPIEPDTDGFYYALLAKQADEAPE